MIAVLLFPELPAKFGRAAVGNAPAKAGEGSAAVYFIDVGQGDCALIHSGDTDILIDLMNRMGYKQPRLTSEEIMDEIASLTPSFGGISHHRLDREGGLQWPCTDKNHPGTPIMHVGKRNMYRVQSFRMRNIRSY